MPWLTTLADVARRTGYPVTEVSGWKSRGHGPQPEVRGIVCHHTAGAAGGGDYPSLAVVRDGRTGLAGPLSHFGLGRSGRIYVIAAGRCWHNAPSTSAYHDNSSSLGIEAENDGRQPWPAVQLDAYKKLCAELCREFGLPASRVKAHREVNTDKPDPHSVDMNDFRADVARLIEGDDVPEYVSVGIDADQTIKPRQWTHLNWDKEYSDSTGQHADKGGWTLLRGPAKYALTVSVQLRGLPAGTEGQIRAVESRDDEIEYGPISEFVATTGDTYVLYGVPADSIIRDRLLRVQIIHFGGGPCTVVDGNAKLLYWR